MTPRDHVARAQALAESATDPRDIAAYKAVAAAWERMSRPAVTWSHEPARRQLAQLQRDAAALLEQPALEPTEPVGIRQIERTVRVPVTTITF